MKSILVIDTPKDCLYCPCFRARDESFNFDDCKLALRPLTVDERDNKPNWCPLKPLPQKEDDLRYFDSYSEGWNDCLDKILGEKE